MDWHGGLGIVAGLLQVSSIIPYAKDILKGSTRPNVVSFVIWTLIEVVAMVAQFSAGASWSVILLIATTFNTSLVVVLCFMGYGYKKYGLLDKFCFVLAIAAIILWQVTRQPLVAIVLAVLADILASVPTIVKTYHDPHSEMVLPWFMIVVAAVLGIISTTKLNAANLVYPIYLFAMNAIITSVAFWGQHTKTRQVEI